MHLGVSFYCSNFSELRALWESHEVRLDRTRGTDVSIFEPVGGAFWVLDWDRGEIELDVPVNGATGFAHEPGRFLVCTHGSVLSIDSSGRVESEFRHRHFNNLHSICLTEEGFLVASSGLDLLLGLDSLGRTSFEWSAREHGFDTDPLGRVHRFDREADYSRVFFATLHDTTHVNSVRLAPDRATVFATLYHQGAVVEIDRSSGDLRSVLTGLVSPHAVEFLDGERFVVASSGDDRVVLATRAGGVDCEIRADFSWPQFVTPLTTGNLLVADGDNNCLKEICLQDGAVVRAFQFDSELRVQEVQELPWW